LSDPLNHLVQIVSPFLPHGKVESTSQALKTSLSSKFSAAELESFVHLIDEHGQEWGVYGYHPIACEILTTMVQVFTGPLPILGFENAQEALMKAKNGERVIMVGNHLSYGDVNYLHSQLELNGLPHYPLLVMSGPKVFTDPFRRLSSMCFDVLKMAQPPSRASDGADVSLRQLAEVTRMVIKEAVRHQGMGKILFFFPEGSRSRSGGMERFLSASARYCSEVGTTVYPIGFSGTDGLLGVDGKGIRLGDMQLSIGAGISFDECAAKLPKSPRSQRKAWMDLLGFAVAAQLPEKLRGVYGGDLLPEDMVDWRYLL
jgi:1-acyl-sn-glycerol-3-phosphate acyltransferase